MYSPYQDIDKKDWPHITARLIDAFPLSVRVLKRTATEAFKDVFRTTVGSSKTPLTDVILSGATRGGVVGALFEHIFVTNIIREHGENNWRVGDPTSEPDLVYIPNPLYSLELKTSSQPSRIHGGSSMLMRRSTNSRKDSAGYYLVLNYTYLEYPSIQTIRFGWLDEPDWIGRVGRSGSSQVHSQAAKLKLRVI